MMANHRGDSKLPTTRLKRSWKLINKKGSKRGRLEAMTENRGDNQGDEKKGKTCTRRSSTGKKEGRKACVLFLFFLSSFSWTSHRRAKHPQTAPTYRSRTTSTWNPRTLDLSESRGAPRKNSAKIFAVHQLEGTLPSTPSFRERAAPSKTLIRKFLCKSFSHSSFYPSIIHQSRKERKRTPWCKHFRH